MKVEPFFPALGVGPAEGRFAAGDTDRGRVYAGLGDGMEGEYSHGGADAGVAVGEDSQEDVEPACWRGRGVCTEGE